MKRAVDLSEEARVDALMYAPSPRAVFVFGSNTAGKHGGGAARVAWTRFGAAWGIGEGPTTWTSRARRWSSPPKHGFTTSPFERRLNVLGRQRTFYEKILAALKAGYAIIPNFQMNVFAIRTKAKAPRSESRAGQYNQFPQRAQLLTQGEGAYVSPQPLVVTTKTKDKDGQGRDVERYFQSPDDEFQDVEFPIALAKPQLMSRVGEAMAAKLFDEVGVAVDTWNRNRGGGHGDPVLLGRLLNPRTNRPSVSFFLGWYFDPSKL